MTGSGTARRGGKRPKSPRKGTREKPIAEQAPLQPGVPPASCTARQRKHLRGLGHRLRPVVLVGKEGLRDGVIARIREALVEHELIKVKLLQNCALDKDEAAQAMSERAGALLVQRVGRTCLLYAPHPREPRITLPGPGPANEDQGSNAAG